MTKVVCGVHALELDLAGKTVAELRKALGQALNIDPECVALVNARPVEDDYRAQAQDILEFVRRAGEKGQINVREKNSHGL